MRKVKCVLVGDAGVGKTCIAERAVHNEFKEGTYATVGAANLTLTVNSVMFNIWDTAGQEKYRSLAPMYFVGAHVAVLVFDISQKETLTKLREFVDLLAQRAPEDCIYVLVGNKCDQEEHRQVTEKDAIDYQNEIGAVFYIETSAQNGTNVNELFERVASSECLHFEAEQPDYLIDVSPDDAGTKKSKKGCC